MIRIFESIEEAKKTILKRSGLAAEEAPQKLLDSIAKVFGKKLTPYEAVAVILEDVKARGDDALREWTKKIDGVELKDIAVSTDQKISVSEEWLEPMRESAANIRKFYEQLPLKVLNSETPDGTMGQRVIPLDRVGFYVPGGSAPLPSTVLMSVIPARVAGVKEIVVCTPPGKPDGNIPEVIIAAAKLAGVEKIYRVGGAIGIAAMAYGTQSVPKVDKIVGPGNIFVAMAKQQVAGFVGLDGIAGPTETVIIGDDTANPAWIAADLLAQAEHDPMAIAIFMTPSRKLAEAVQREVADQAAKLPRRDILDLSIPDKGGIVLTPDLETAVKLGNEFAPEHICLSVKDPKSWLDKIRFAGTAFLGEYSFEVLGDYMAGPTHVLPTSATARFASPLNLLDFVRTMNFLALTPEQSKKLSPLAARFAAAEGLDAHRQAALKRFS
jgi:histidinol dehydrogenase